MVEWSHVASAKTIVSSLAPDRIHVWQFRLDGRAELDLLDATERARAGRFVFERDRVRFVVAHSILRKVLASYLHGTAAAEIEFEASCNGKPTLAPAMKTNLAFNLSHSDRFGILALGLGFDIGIDIEMLREPREIRSLAESVMSDAECADFAEVPENKLAHPFFTAWTRKEACMKATGDGLRLSPKALNVGLAPISRHLELRRDVQGEVRTIIDDGVCLASIATVGQLPPLHFFEFADN